MNTYLDPDIKLLGDIYFPPLDTSRGILLISQEIQLLFIFIDYPDFKWSFVDNNWGIKVNNKWWQFSYVLEDTSDFMIDSFNKEASITFNEAHDIMLVAYRYMDVWLRVYHIGRTQTHNQQWTAQNVVSYCRLHAQIPLWEK